MSTHSFSERLEKDTNTPLVAGLDQIDQSYFVHPWSVSIVNPRRPVSSRGSPLASRLSSTASGQAADVVLVQLNALLTAREDIARLLDCDHSPHSQRCEWLAQVMDALEIGACDNKHPNHLSDEMQWRVLLAKAAITQPEALLIGRGFKRLAPLRQTRVMSRLQRLAQVQQMAVIQH